MRINDWSSDVCSSDRVDYGVGGPLLLEKVDFSVEPGERIALIGRNGAGKSTLLRPLSGDIRADDGELRLGDGVRIAGLRLEGHGVGKEGVSRCSSRWCPCP